MQPLHGDGCVRPGSDRKCRSLTREPGAPGKIASASLCRSLSSKYTYVAPACALQADADSTGASGGCRVLREQPQGRNLQKLGGWIPLRAAERVVRALPFRGACGSACRVSSTCGIALDCSVRNEVPRVPQWLLR